MTQEKQKPQSNNINFLNFQSQQTENKQKLSVANVKLWLLWGVYIYILLLSPPGQIIGGQPVWAIQTHTIQEAINESINFYFIVPLFNALGINTLISPWVHPISQGLFNFAEAWMLMFLPLLLADPQGGKLPKLGLWSLAMFLTNVFLIPYMALRTPSVSSSKLLPDNKDFLKRVLGWIAIVVGFTSILWGCFAFPDTGNLVERGQYFLALLTRDRLTIAFVVDLILFAIFQVILLGAIIPANHQRRWLRFIPFGGLAIWLIIF